MIVFQTLRTARIQLEMRELIARDAIYLCQLPPEQNERGTTELIRRIVEPAAELRSGQVADPRLWSVQERAFVVAHYLAHIAGGDFPIGESAKYSNYVGEIAPPPAPVSLGHVGGRDWMLQPLLGWHAEAIERLVVAEELSADLGGWMVGAMAAQVFDASEGPLAGVENTDVVIDAQIAERATALTGLPESEFAELVSLYRMRQGEVDHVFRLAFTDDGIAFLPEKEVPGVPPARFQFPAAVREDTKDLFGTSSRAAN